MGYARSPFRDIESFFKIVVCLDRDAIQLMLKEYNSNFVTNNLVPGIYSIKDISKPVYTMADHEGPLKIDFDEISKKIKLILTRFGSTFGTLSFDEKSFLNTLLGFTPYWDYKPTNAIHADSPGAYTSEKNLNLSKRIKIHLKCDVNDGGVVNGVRQPIPFTFDLGRLPGYKIFHQPETVHHIKINKFVLNFITFYLEDNNNEEVNLIEKR